MNSRNLAILLTIVSWPLKAQHDDRGLEQRVSDHLARTSFAQFLSATRYVPIVSVRGLGNWSAPANIVELKGMPFETFPLNLVSPDYVPFDLIQTDTIPMDPRPSLAEAGSYPSGRIVLRSRPISDSLEIRGRVYGGSETGDVILDEYTRDNLPFYNRNKIGFSGSGMVEGRTGTFGYRLTAAGFNYFSVGYEDRDRIVLSYIDAPTFSRPNRNYVGAAELEWKGSRGRSVSAYAGMNTFTAWEQIPFASTFGFFSGSIGTIRLSAQDLIPFLSIGVRRDGAFVSMRSQKGTAGGEYDESVTGIHLLPHFNSGTSIRISLPLEYVVREISVPAGNAQFFTRNDLRKTWAVGLRGEAGFAGGQFLAAVRAERTGNGPEYFSATLRALVGTSDHSQIEVTVSSLVRPPSALEQHGTFSVARIRQPLAQTDTFRVSGNPELLASRTTGGDATFTTFGDVRGAFSVFAYMIGKEIRRRPTMSIRSADPGDLVFSAMYENHDRAWYGGLEVRLGADIGDRMVAELGYVWTRNHAQLPRHQLRFTGTWKLAGRTTGSVSFHGMTRTHWPEFAVSSANDEFTGAGSDGMLPEYWTLDCAVIQDLGTVWFLADLQARLELQNLLYREVRMFPIGVTRDFAVIGYLTMIL